MSNKTKFYVNLALGIGCLYYTGFQVLRWTGVVLVCALGFFINAATFAYNDAKAGR